MAEPYVEAKSKDHQTAWLLATEKGHEDVAWLLLDYGADAESKNAHGGTALNFVLWNGHDATAWLFQGRLCRDIL